MKEMGKILAYFAAVLLCGALLAPPLYWLGQWAVHADLLPQLGRFKFPRYFNRAILLAALLFLWPFLRWFGVTRWRDFALRANQRRWHDLLFGCGVSVAGLGLVALLLWTTGQVQWRGGWPWSKLASIGVTAAAVSLLEEFFFRGALFGVLRRRLPWPRALAFLSVFFAVLHFLKPEPGVGAFRVVHWYAGFTLLPHAFWQFREPALVLGGFLTLLLVGWILGYSVVKTRSLYMAIGLHGGWVLALQTFSLLTTRVGAPSVWFGQELTSGVVALLLLTVTLAAVMWHVRRRHGEGGAAALQWERHGAGRRRKAANCAADRGSANQ